MARTEAVLTPNEVIWVQQGELGDLRLVERTSPSPIAGTGQLFVKSSDGDLYFMDGNGNEVNLSTTTAGTVTSFSFTDGNGFDGTVTNSTTTPTLSLTTSLTQGSVPIIGASGALSEDNTYFNYNSTSHTLFLHHLAGDASDGLLIESNNGTDVALFGAGNGSNATFYGGVNIGTTTTSGTATVAFSPTMSGSSAVSNFLNITGTMPSPTSAQARAISLSVTSNGSSSNAQYLMNVSLGAGYTGTGSTVGINLANLAQGTGSAFWTNGSYNVGIYSSGSGTTAGHNVGFAGNASASSTLNVGVYGRSTASTNSPVLNIGNVALATGATYNIGAFFGLFSASPTIAQSAVVMADNGSTGSDIFVARVNGTKTTTIDGAGNLGVGTTPTVRLDVLGNTNLVNTNNFRSVTTSQDTSSVGPLLLTQSVTDQTVTGALKNALIDVTVDYPSAPSVSTTNNALSVYASVPSTNTTSSTNVNLTGFNVSSRAFKTTGNIGAIRGLNITARSDSGGTTSNIIGNTTVSSFAGVSGTVSGQITGVNGQAAVSSAATSATVATMNGLLAFVGNSSTTATVTNAYGIRMADLTNAGTITNTYGFYCGDVTAGTQTNTAYSFYASDASAKNYFAGNVGIGNTSPTSKLDITGSTGSYSSGIGFTPTGTGARNWRTFINTDGSFNLDDATSVATRLTINSSGNVGIGTTSPAYKLETKYSFTGFGSAIAFPMGTTVHTTDGAMSNGFGSAYAFSIQDNVSGPNRIGYIGAVMSNSSKTTGDLVLYTSNAGSESEKMRVQYNGNVGINETAPDYKLDVNGSFGFTPGTSVTPVDNGDVVIEATNDTTLTFKLKGSDGTIRTATLTLA